jgi:hypothetical protein
MIPISPVNIPSSAKSHRYTDVSISRIPGFVTLTQPAIPLCPRNLRIPKAKNAEMICVDWYDTQNHDRRAGSSRPV